LTFDYEGYSFKKGQTYHMNGAKALAFSRMRYDDPKATMAAKNGSAWSLPL
jgi:anionic cell wall polymer biosynthesis LytR-Cps2A-Psr (LCP) family protein